MVTPTLSYRFVCFCGSRFSNRNLLISHSSLYCFNQSPLFCGEGLERGTFCRFCGERWPDLPTRNHHESVAHWDRFDVSSCLISNGLKLSLTGQEKNLSSKEDLLSYLEDIPDGVVVADVADAYAGLMTDILDLVHSKRVIVLHSEAVGDVIYPIQSMGLDKEIKRLFFQSEARNIDSILKCQRMQGIQTWKGSSKRAAAAESSEKNKRFKG